MRFLLPLALAAALWPCESRAEYYSGNELYRMCTADRSSSTFFQSEATCISYVVGVHDGQYALAAFLAYVGDQDRPVIPYCVPDGVEAGQLRDIVVAYLRDNPANRNLSAGLLVMMALAETYPCS